MRLLVIEDEPKVGQALREGLQAEGYEALQKAGGVAYYRYIIGDG